MEIFSVAFLDSLARHVLVLNIDIIQSGKSQGALTWR